MEDVLKQICSHSLFKNKPVGVKLAPYFDNPYFEQATTIISKYDIKFVVSINTIGNALFVDTENECVSMLAKDGFGEGVECVYIFLMRVVCVCALYIRVCVCCVYWCVWGIECVHVCVCVC